MEYAIIDFGGKQYKVTPGLMLDVEGTAKVGENINFDKVLLYVNGEDFKIGTPHILGFKVDGKVLANKKGEKIRVSKFKAKSKYRKTIGFRHTLTTVEILPFEKNDKKPPLKKEKSK